MGKARIKAKDEAGGSQVGENKAKLVGWWFGSINGMVGLVLSSWGVVSVSVPAQ